MSRKELKAYIRQHPTDEDAIRELFVNRHSPNAKTFPFPYEMSQQELTDIFRHIKQTDRTGNSVGKIYLVDFGSVQTVVAKEGGTMTVVGTYGYMPPEQFGGRTVPASDIYSFGATLIYDVLKVQHRYNLSFCCLLLRWRSRPEGALECGMK